MVLSLEQKPDGNLGTWNICSLRQGPFDSNFIYFTGLYCHQLVTPILGYPVKLECH